MGDNCIVTDICWTYTMCQRFFLVISTDLPSKQLSERNIFPRNFTQKTKMYAEEEVIVKVLSSKNWEEIQ